MSESTPSPVPVDQPLITDDRSKLPPAIAALADVAAPIPVDVHFFERRITAGSVVSALAWSIGFTLFGILCSTFGALYLVDSMKNPTVYSTAQYFPLGFGLLCLFCAWLLCGKAVERWRLRAAQESGQPTRVGIFLTPAGLFEVAESSYALIPPACIAGIDPAAVRYTHNAVEKLIHLPASLIGSTPTDLQAALITWFAKVSLALR